jgi:hypothetical protein
MTSRKKPGVAFWATVVLTVLLVVYPLSFGPACWIASRSRPTAKLTIGGNRIRMIGIVYWPILTLAWHTEMSWDAVLWYSMVGAERGWTVANQGNNSWAFVYLGNDSDTCKVDPNGWTKVDQNGWTGDRGQ